MEKLDIFDLDSIQEFIKNGKEKAKEMASELPEVPKSTSKSKKV